MLLCLDPRTPNAIALRPGHESLVATQPYVEPEPRMAGRVRFKHQKPNPGTPPLPGARQPSRLPGHAVIMRSSRAGSPPANGGQSAPRHLPLHNRKLCITTQSRRIRNPWPLLRSKAGNKKLRRSQPITRVVSRSMFLRPHDGSGRKLFRRRAGEIERQGGHPVPDGEFSGV
jgi:hypothetical protein